MIGRPAMAQMVHVAAESENRGRVVLQVRSGRPHPLAIDLAVRIAHAYQARLEGLFVEEPQLVDGAAHAFVNEVSLSGRAIHMLEVQSIETMFGFDARSARRLIVERAETANVPVDVRITRDETLRALAVACAENGPWNMIVLGDAFGPYDQHMLAQTLGEIAGTTALVAVGPRASRSTGPIVLLVESADRLDGMLRLAERLSSDMEDADKPDLRLIPVADTAQDCEDLDTQLRLVLEGNRRVGAGACLVTFGAPEVAAEAIRRSNAGLVVAQFGGTIVSDSHDLRDLAQCLECPIVLVR